MILVGCITLNVQVRAQSVRKPFLLRAQASVRQHEVDRDGERRGAQFLRRSDPVVLPNCMRHASIHGFGKGVRYAHVARSNGSGDSLRSVHFTLKGPLRREASGKFPAARGNTRTHADGDQRVPAFESMQVCVRD